MAIRAAEKAMDAYQVARSEKKVKTILSHTNVGDPATPDGVLNDWNGTRFITTAIIEAKVRYAPITYENIQNNPFYNKSLVVDQHKMDNCSAVAAALCVEFWSICVFEAEGIYIVQKIKDKWGQLIPHCYTKDTLTRESINSSKKKLKPMVYISIEGHEPYRL